MTHEQMSNCPFCEGPVVLVQSRQEFPYGDRGSEVTLSAVVPVLECPHCGIEFDAEGADRARHEAVCMHLRRLAPRQIKEIRVKRGWTQEELAARGTFGIASVKRWERGYVIQDASSDLLLRVLADKQGAALIEKISGSIDQQGGIMPTLAFKEVDAGDACLAERERLWAF